MDMDLQFGGLLEEGFWQESIMMEFQSNRELRKVWILFRKALLKRDLEISVFKCYRESVWKESKKIQTSRWSVERIWMHLVLTFLGLGFKK